MRLIRRLLSGLLATAVLGGVALWAWTTIGDVAPDDLGDIEMSVDMTFRGVEMVQGQNGTITWSVNATRADYDLKKKTILLYAPDILYSGDQVNGTVRVTAPQGLVDRNKESVRLWPDVSATYGETVVRSEEMVYLEEPRILRFSGNVHLARPDLELAGKRAEVQLESDVLTVEENVAVRIFSSPGPARGIP